ncbi:hypothetical protein AB0K12_39055 [Nonomuraea sp. NPDC049419]|uniref:hypothetical protein n=1 Tax=Nonomuraea sp. NPDC049419 TaxID=3155772 RepID=UPI00342F44A8
MTRLHRALDDIAAEAPLVDLAEAAIARHRRRRLVTASLSAVAVAAIVGAGGVVMTAPWQVNAVPAVPAVQVSPGVEQAEVVPDLPDAPVGALSHAYETRCEQPPCGDEEWRVVTADGATYRLPRALTRTTGKAHAPIAISRNGRMLAYYSRDAQAHVVRDLETGAETVSPVKVPEKKIPLGAMLLVSDDGRYLAFDDPEEFDEYAGVLIDMQAGEPAMLPRGFQPVAIKDGVLELVRHVKTDLWLMPVTGGGEPVRFDGTFISFSEVAPDGRTVVALEMHRPTKASPGAGDGTAVVKRKAPELTVLDAATGEIVRKVPTPDVPGDPTATVWLSDTEVLVRDGAKGRRTYALDITSGKARLLTDYGDLARLTLPGQAINR